MTTVIAIDGEFVLILFIWMADTIDKRINGNALID